MNFVTTNFKGVWVIEPRVFGDHRGFFMETYSQRLFEQQGIQVEFIQDNHSRSEQSGVLRGLHYQLPPKAQTKLIRVTAGSILDVIVDLRSNSTTFGNWESYELSADNKRMLYVPAGFAHGFCTTAPGTEVQYKVDELYAPEYENGIIWNDPDLGIQWPVDAPILSQKDTLLQSFKGFISPF